MTRNSWQVRSLPISFLIHILFGLNTNDVNFRPQPGHTGDRTTISHTLNGFLEGVHLGRWIE